MKPMGIQRKVRRATRGLGLWTNRPSWKMIGLKSLFLATGSHLVLGTMNPSLHIDIKSWSVSLSPMPKSGKSSPNSR